MSGITTLKVTKRGINLTALYKVGFARQVVRKRLAKKKFPNGSQDKAKITQSWGRSEISKMKGVRLEMNLNYFALLQHNISLLVSLPV